MTTSEAENKLKSYCVCSCLIPPFFSQNSDAIHLEYGNINCLCQWLDLGVTFNSIIFALASEVKRPKAQVTKAVNEKTASQIGMEKCVQWMIKKPQSFEIL